MNPILASIQQIQQQQIQAKMSALLKQSAQALVCGPDCQRIKISGELKQKYLDAETNLQTAPIKFEQSKKNYYTYTEGSSYYNNLQEEELKQKAESIAKLLGENFNEELTNAFIMNKYYNTALINSNHTSELYKNTLQKNEALKLKLRNRYGDILTNDRKTYYETDALERLKLWYKFWWYVYYFLILIFLLSMILAPSQITMFYKSIILILLIFYPYYINYILSYIYNGYKILYDNIPKNIYNNL